MGSHAEFFVLFDVVAAALIVALTCENVVGVTVFWFRTSRTGVSRHAGLMSPEIPD
jgi:hypothetical protein